MSGYFPCSTCAGSVWAGVDHTCSPTPQRPAFLRAEVERLRAEAAILGPEMVDLQHRLLRAEQERDELRAEVGEQARLNGMGSEREARLMAERDEARGEVLGLRRMVEMLTDGLLDLAMPTTRADYTTADLDRVVCGMATETLARIDVDAEAAYRAREDER